MPDQQEAPRSGVHRKKRQVDRPWLDGKLKDSGLTVTSFGAALARETHRSHPLDKASMSRRLQGRIPFTAQEVEAMSRMFSVELAEVLRRVGSSDRDMPTVAGTIAADGAVTLNLAAPRRGAYQLRLTVENGWAGAKVAVAAVGISPLAAARGLYVVHSHQGGAALRQLLGTQGQQVILGAAFDTLVPVETKATSSIATLQKVISITL